MNIEKIISTKITLSVDEVTNLIKKHIKDTQGIDVDSIYYAIDYHQDDYELGEVVCQSTIKD